MGVAMDAFGYMLKAYKDLVKDYAKIIRKMKPNQALLLNMENELLKALIELKQFHQEEVNEHIIFTLVHYPNLTIDFVEKLFQVKPADPRVILSNRDVVKVMKDYPAVHLKYYLGR